MVVVVGVGVKWGFVYGESDKMVLVLFSDLVYLIELLVLMYYVFGIDLMSIVYNYLN